MYFICCLNAMNSINKMIAELGDSLEARNKQEITQITVIASKNWGTSRQTKHSVRNKKTRL